MDVAEGGDRMTENPVLRTEACSLCAGSGQRDTYTWPVHCEPACVGELQAYHPGTLLCYRHSSLSYISMPVLWSVEQRDATVAYLAAQAVKLGGSHGG